MEDYSTVLGSAMIAVCGIALFYKLVLTGKFFRELFS